MLSAALGLLQRIYTKGYLFQEYNYLKELNLSRPDTYGISILNRAVLKQLDLDGVGVR